MQKPFRTEFIPGTVYLIGGGSGSRNHLTLEADSILSQAEIILHDMFMDSLREYYPDAIWIHAGKQKGVHTKNQGEINELLIRYAKEGKKTVRLKAGDVSFFARSAEEIGALRDHGVNVKFILGISSPQLLSENLTNSLTHRTQTRSISYWSGYWDKDIKSIEIPQSDAHIIFMGLGELENIVKRFLESGKNENTSLIAASNLGRPNQKIVRTTLKAGVKDIRNAVLENPTLIAIGLDHVA